MLDVTWTVAPSVPAHLDVERVMILVDRPTAHPRLLRPFQSSHAQRSPAWIMLLWVITPSTVMNWSALMAEPLEARTSTMMAALGDRMAEARRRLTPLQRAATAAGLDLHVRIAHGALLETTIRIAREERIQRLLVPPTWGETHNQPHGGLLDHLTQRLHCAVETID